GTQGALVTPYTTLDGSHREVYHADGAGPDEQAGGRSAARGARIEAGVGERACASPGAARLSRAALGPNPRAPPLRNCGEGERGGGRRSTRQNCSHLATS